MNPYIFVYGTLLEPSLNTIASYLHYAAEEKEAATVRGRLYNLGAFPGLVLDKNAAHVNGMLMRIEEEYIEPIHEILDKYEGVNHVNPIYEKTETIVIGLSKVVKANVYAMLVEPPEEYLIPSGDWARFISDNR